MFYRTYSVKVPSFGTPGTSSLNVGWSISRSAVLQFSFFLHFSWGGAERGLCDIQNVRRLAALNLFFGASVFGFVLLFWPGGGDNPAQFDCVSTRWSAEVMDE